MFIRRLDAGCGCTYATMVLSSNYGQLLQQCRLMRLIDLRPPPEQLDPPLVHQGRRCRSDQESLLALGIEPTTSRFRTYVRNHSAKASPKLFYTANQGANHPLPHLLSFIIITLHRVSLLGVEFGVRSLESLDHYPRSEVARKKPLDFF